MNICAFAKAPFTVRVSARFRRHQSYEHREREGGVGWELTCLRAFRQRLPPRFVPLWLEFDGGKYSMWALDHAYDRKFDNDGYILYDRSAKWTGWSQGKLAA